MSDDTSAGEQFRQVTDKAIDAFGETVDNVVASEQFSAAVAKYMNGLAFTSAAIKGVTHRVSDFAADWFNTPTRDQLTGVAERITRLELAVDDIEMNTETLQELLERQDPDG